MKIINTRIPDINDENINESKLELANKLINVIYPIIDDLRSSKFEKFSSLKHELKNKTKKIKQSKEELKELMVNYQRQKKMNKLLERISKIVSAGLANNSFKNEIIVLLKVIDTLSEDKLNHYLSETIKTINKRFSISI